MVKNLPDNAGDVSLIPGSGRAPGGGHGTPLQFSYLENPMDREAWRVTVHGIAKELDLTAWLSTPLHCPCEVLAFIQQLLIS